MAQATTLMLKIPFRKHWRRLFFSHNTFNIWPAGPSSPPRARGYIPANITLFLGRDPEVEELVLLLTQDPGDGKRARICILGPGGMGKTELATTVLNHPEIQSCYPLRNLLFVACVQAVSAPLFLDMLYAALDIARDTHNTLSDILDELRSSGPLVLLLDNLETPLLADGAREQVEQILRDIEQIPHVALFVTMRGSNAPCEGSLWTEKKIEPLDPQASHRLFTEICPKARGDLEVAELVESLGYMPLAVTLMAKLGKATEWKARELLNSFRTAGLTMLGPSEGSDSRNSVNVSIRLSVESPLIQRTPDASTLLIIISMLPSGTTSSHLQKYWAWSLSNLPAALQALLYTSLLECRSEAYFVLPVIRSYILEPSRVPEDVALSMVQGACKFLQDHDCDVGDPDYKKHLLARSALEINLQTILLNTTDPDSDVVEALYGLGWHQYRTRPRLEIIEHAVKLMAGIQDYKLQGRVLQCYGTILESLDRSRDALKQHKLARKAFIRASETRLAALTLLEIADNSTLLNPDFDEISLMKRALIELRYHDKPLVFKLIRQYRFLHLIFPIKPVANEDMARCLSQLGDAHSRRHNYSKAVKALIRARDMSLEGSIQAAICAENLAAAYYRSRHYSDAEKWALIACKEWKQLGSSAGRSLFILGRTYISKFKFPNAVEALTEGLELATVRGDVSWTAAGLLELGRAYMKMGETQSARNALVEAIRHFQASEGNEEEIVCARFYLDRLDDPSRNPSREEKQALRRAWRVEDARA
ncbi:P-loop containing nucleoside triphosphate hydrolase protein [Mycena floridula]|nr:P-loop containing nucleoside triphosphate hydrolase protein [Mycena floridula]